MDTLSLRITALALPTALALALLLAPIQVHAGDGTSDCHEVPKFVLDRTEIVSGVN